MITMTIVSRDGQRSLVSIRGDSPCDNRVKLSYREAASTVFAALERAGARDIVGGQVGMGGVGGFDTIWILSRWEFTAADPAAVWNAVDAALSAAVWDYDHQLEAWKKEAGKKEEDLGVFKLGGKLTFFQMR